MAQKMDISWNLGCTGPIQTRSHLIFRALVHFAAHYWGKTYGIFKKGNRFLYIYMYIHIHDPESTYCPHENGKARSQALNHESLM